MRFIVGLKFGDEDDGALSFAGWLKTCTKEAAFIAHHTIEFQLRTMEPDIAYQLDAGSHRVANKALEKVGLDGVEVGVAPDGTPESNLASAAKHNEADAVVVGRRARTEDRRIFRLGGVARRLLRELPVPVIVAPPDLASAGVPNGPVLLALDGETDARQAAAFAGDFARAIDRQLVLAHVYPTVAQIAAPYVPTAYWGRVRDEWRSASRDEVRRSIEAMGLGALRRLEGEGAVIPGLIQVAREESACMVVCSSRQLATSARFFTSSVGSALAAYAPFPVAVVPSGQ